MSKINSDVEHEANKFDLDLFNLVRRAERNAYHFRGGKKEWEEIAAALDRVRPKVREKMSAKDRRATS